MSQEAERPALKVPAGAVIICGVPAGQHAKWLCPCCGFESNDKADFAVTVCWACASGNPDCETCIRMGIEFGRFSTSRGKAHRFSTWDPPGVSALMTCGYRIPYTDLGSGVSLQPCRKCWPAYVLETAA